MSAATLTAHGATITVERVGSAFEIRGPKYQCTIPVCGCERPVCAGRCSVPSSAKVAVRDKHNREMCHGDLKHGMHAEHIDLFAARVLGTFAPPARKPWTPNDLVVKWSGEIPGDIQAQIDVALAERKAQGLKPGAALKVPNVGAARDFDHSRRAFLPLDGEETVSALHATDGKWVVLCDSLRCRDEHGRVSRISEWAAGPLADGAAERHRQWHKDMREGVSNPEASQPLTLRLTAAEIEVGDWYRNADGWQRIALKQSYRAGTRSVMIWDANEKLIGTLDIYYDYLIVRGGEDPPNWTPTPDAARSRYVPGGVR